ncbi:uncharacterized protein EAF02_003701 [Botrytis sinoallii]|uniref:uncharacterized protein n=1 Tax=Botrytis sinoallii TaxID=1463999 RepID=UPI00190060D0|nr:uncharacterized protein EAF02_003701 [Botrytis sinoallii]KAF7887054.1 hypothetical protein EAF02_003701 [Botrytis sinoallii]
MYTKISQLTTTLAILFTLTTALPAPPDTNTKTSSSASGDNDAIATCALNLSTCTNATATAKRDADNPEKRVATVCTNGAWGSVACVGAFGMCMKTADGAGEITSCALALSACEVGVNTK